MGDKLYLIRVDMERFIGPATLREIKEAYRRMEFGLQDEIASSNKPWVAFDDLDRINRIYPELSLMIKKEMLGGWGTTESDAKANVKSIHTGTTGKNKTGSLIKWILALIVVGILGTLGYLLQTYRLKDIPLLIQEPLYMKALIQYGDRYNPKFEAFMDRNKKEINQSIVKNRKMYRLWLPFIRAVAFKKDGSWPGLSAVRLRDKDAQYAPVDCSYKAWLTRWQESHSEWKGFLAGSILPEKDWAKVLVWDEVWIKQRTLDPNWRFPANYYEACLRIARKALKKSATPELQAEANIFNARLKWSISTINGEEIRDEFQMSGGLWSLSCIESTLDGDQLDSCTADKKAIPAWKELIERRIELRKARLLLINHSRLSEPYIKQLRQQLEKIAQKDPYTRFDYKEEMRFLQVIMQNGGDIEKAAKKYQDRKPALKFDY